MDDLDCQIQAMTAAFLTDLEILYLARVRCRYPYEPGWPPLSLAALEFARWLADHAVIGRADRYPTLVTIQTVEAGLDFAGEGQRQQRPEYTGGGSSYPAEEVPDYDG